MFQNLVYQVEVRKGSTVQVAWIEGYGTRIGAIVEVKLDEGIRDPHWAVSDA